MIPRNILPLAGTVLLLGAAGCTQPMTQKAGKAAAEVPQAGLAQSKTPVLLPVEGDPTVSFTVWFQVGSQDDPVGKEGLAHLTGALIARGSTTAHSYEEILRRLYPLASTYEVRVDKEMTTLTGRTHVDNLETFFQLLTSAYLEPAFTAEDFERLRSEQLNALENTLRYSSDEELGKAALTAAIFDGTRYRHPAIGTVTGLQAITRDDVAAFYRRHYTRDNTVVALGGGYPGELVDRFTATLTRLPDPAEAETPVSITPPALTGRRVLLVAKPNADASISFGFPISVQRGEDDFYALWVANSWLGEHRNSSSHLYGVIREARGLNYGDYSYVEAFPDGGRRQMPPPNVARRHQIFEVWIRTLPNEQAVFALRAALRELRLLVENGLSEEQFQLTRTFLGKYYLHFAETTQMRLGYAVDDRFYGVPGNGHLARFGEKIRVLTRDQVNAAIQKHLQVDDLQIAIVTGAAETLQQQLTSGAPSSITYASPKSEAILAEDQLIGQEPLTIAAEAVKTVPVTEIFEN